MKLGKFQIDTIETGRFGLDGGAMFGVVPKNLWAKAYNPGDEQNRIPMAARCLLIQFDDKKILVDTGNGEKFGEKLAAIYGIDNSLYTLENSLLKAGVKSDDITDVILTHLHFDHTGGSTKFENNELIPTFKNAKYYVQKDHYTWAQNPKEKDRASFLKENWEPLFGNGMVELLDGEGEVFKGISVLLANGHTKALQMVKVSDGRETLLFPADLMPTSAHVPVPYGMGYDNFPLTTIEEKKKLLPQIAEEKWLVCFEHDAFTQAAYVQHTEKGFSKGEMVEITKY
jgi:glyoxylase-like metal-dependent hydrolase (beta-lactamase superfamily II)